MVQRLLWELQKQINKLNSKPRTAALKHLHPLEIESVKDLETATETGSWEILCVDLWSSEDAPQIQPDAHNLKQAGISED